MHRILETPDMEHVRHKYEEMKAKLDGLWDSLYSEWASRVPGEVSTNLVKTLLTRHENNTISTNFAPEVRAAACCGDAAITQCLYFIELLVAACGSAARVPLFAVLGSGGHPRPSQRAVRPLGGAAPLGHYVEPHRRMVGYTQARSPA